MHLYMRSFLALETSCSLALKARIKSFSWSWQRAQHPHLPAKSDQSLEDLCRIGLDALQPGDDLKPSLEKDPIFAWFAPIPRLPLEARTLLCMLPMASIRLP